MKIIDLLVKIANHEIELGTKFIWHYTWYDITLTYMERCGALGLYFRDGLTPDGEINWIGLFERFNYTILNDEIEIIEENKEIEKILISMDDNGPFVRNNQFKQRSYSKIDLLLANKINGLIDEVNKLKGGK